ncbi:MAG: DNA-directed RNA polymerase subunit delta [Firmicutes bacterium]|nr:DNA-directed RNA polymerase subunit delta [Bacillota bacterium]
MAELNFQDEPALIDVAYQVLAEYGQPLTWSALFDRVAERMAMSEEALADVLPHLYLQLNTDIRFLWLGHNEWGLRSWYPAEKTAASKGNRHLTLHDLEDEEEEEEDDFFDEEQEVLASEDEEEPKEIDEEIEEDEEDEDVEEDEIDFDDEVIDEDLGEDEDEDKEYE